MWKYTFPDERQMCYIYPYLKNYNGKMMELGWGDISGKKSLISFLCCCFWKLFKVLEKYIDCS